MEVAIIRRAILILLVAFTATEASARCLENEELFFSCAFAGGKEVHVCNTGQTARYVFGRPDAEPELSLSVPVEDVHLTPWPGVGRTIWEEVRFSNNGVDYTVFGVIEREYGEADTDEIKITTSGGIIVHEGDVERADLRCLSGTVDFPWGAGLYDAKTALNQCYNRESQRWQTCAE